MKKILISIVTIFAISFFALAEMTIYVYKKDGTKVPYVAADVDSIGFSDVALPEAIDLGLPSGTKWANMNVGANAPEDYGDYFAWGETEPKDVYNWSTYKWCNGTENSLTRYNSNPSLGNLDNMTELILFDDVANVEWGDNWRMPTKEQLEELLDSNNCIWEWTSLNEVKGYLVTSKINGKSIFLPAAGYRWNESSYTKGILLQYWSVSLSEEISNRAYFFNIQEENLVIEIGYRCGGMSIRPVLAK